MTFSEWMDDNLATQGYCLAASDARRLALGLRFPTALCLALVAMGLALESAVLLGALSLIGLAAGVTSRRAFDHLWNHGIRQLLRAPAVPPNPPRRRHAFKVATASLALVAGVFAVGWSTAGIVLGVMLLTACAAVTVFNLCLGSLALSWLERRQARQASAA
jgi:Domain of unknown function (DUF4395)